MTNIEPSFRSDPLVHLMMILFSVLKIELLMKLVVQQFTFAKHVLHKTQSLDDLPNLEVGI